ncbi:MAG: transglutaminase-like domain-containing protein, partial [Planctomycetes bacterium]|nr:transglutaminase-like domain-containing protein [Planctomycetota bacterium]
MNPQPVICRPEAFHLFASQLEQLDSTDALIRAAVAVSMHRLGEVDLERLFGTLRGYADVIRSRVRSKHVEAILAHLHQVLFEDAGFRGDQRNYYDPRNSFLPEVLRRRVGIPITLTLVYKAVAERVGLQVEGINAPGHFLARVYDASGPIIVDPFFRGQMLTSEQALQRLAQVTGRTVPHDTGLLRVATHAQWLSRIIANLQNTFT